jgi:phenylacetate-CoA ligase
MRQKINRYLSLPFQDFKNKTNVIQTYKFLLQSQEWTVEKLEYYQLEKLKKLINHSYYNVPFYRDLFDKNSIKPDNINSLNDINMIPVITKEDVRSAGDNIYSKNYNKNKVFFC